MHFITNGNKQYSKTNSSDPMERVPLTAVKSIPLKDSPNHLSTIKKKIKKKNQMPAVINMASDTQ